MPILTSPFTEVVNGTIIGTYTYPYEFWIEEKRWEYVDKGGKRRVAKGNFENDTLAITWFKENYPVEFKQGVEMRVWDRD
jgi:hypothetical protein